MQFYSELVFVFSLVLQREESFLNCDNNGVIGHLQRGSHECISYEYVCYARFGLPGILVYYLGKNYAYASYTNVSTLTHRTHRTLRYKHQSMFSIVHTCTHSHTIRQTHIHAVKYWIASAASHNAYALLYSPSTKND